MGGRKTRGGGSSSNEENYSIPQRFFAVTCTGRQPNVHPKVDGEVFVFGACDLQLDENGMVILECDRKYIWVPEIPKEEVGEGGQELHNVCRSRGRRQCRFS